MATTPPTQTDEAKASTRKNSGLVAAAILLSRVTGVVRESAFASLFGLSLYADAFRAALRVPNLLQNLLGDGTLSASFVPVYAELLGKDERVEAGEVAGAILAVLGVAAAAVAVLGVVLAPWAVTLVAPGFHGDAHDLAVQLVRILFPMTATLVLSAWSLGVLNSHRRFFLPYVAPVAWNVAILAALGIGAGILDLDPYHLALAAAWGALAGGLLQLAIQLPTLLKLEPHLKIAWNTRHPQVRDALKNALPVIFARGIVQISAYLDVMMGSLLATSAIAALSASQTLYMLPVSLFGMSVAVTELPELARERDQGKEALRARTNAALARVAYYVVPSTVAFWALGDRIVAALYERGRFTADDTRVVHAVLAAYTMGLLPNTLSRVQSSAYFALRDTRTQARVGIARVILASTLGFLFMTQLEPVDLFGFAFHDGLWTSLRIGEHTVGAIGLAIGAGLSSVVEWRAQVFFLQRHIGEVGIPWGTWGKLFAAAILGAVVGVPCGMGCAGYGHVVAAAASCGSFGVVYIATTWAFGLDEARRFGLGKRAPQ